MDGLLVVDKPAGITSHDVVARVRRLLRERRIGHTGTLDPAATGVLPLVVGRATRLARFLSASEKSYEAVIRFGWSTDTGDADGSRLDHPAASHTPTREQVEKALDAFRGTLLQQPPAYSAKKIDGTRSYKLARAHARNARLTPASDESGDPASAEPPALPDPVSVTTSRLDIVSLEGDSVTLTVDCSAGFYVRSLAHDLGARLGVGGHLARLRRVRSGEVTVDQAVGLERLEADPEFAARSLLPLSAMLPGLPAFTLTPDGVRKVSHGRDVTESDGAIQNQPSIQNQSPIPNPESKMSVRLLGPDGALLGIAEPTARGALHPIVVLM